MVRSMKWMTSLRALNGLSLPGAGQGPAAFRFNDFSHEALRLLCPFSIVRRRAPAPYRPARAFRVVSG